MFKKYRFNKTRNADILAIMTKHGLKKIPSRMVFLYARSKTSDILWYGVRPSVCPSVCPSVSHIMSAQYLEKFMSDSHSS